MSGPVTVTCDPGGDILVLPEGWHEKYAKIRDTYAETIASVDGEALTIAVAFRHPKIPEFYHYRDPPIVEALIDGDLDGAWSRACERVHARYRLRPHESGKPTREAPVTARVHPNRECTVSEWVRVDWYERHLGERTMTVLNHRPYLSDAMFPGELLLKLPDGSWDRNVLPDGARVTKIPGPPKRL